MADGGIGEMTLADMALSGAAVGGVGAALTGRDPLKGALLGGALGGIGGLAGQGAAVGADAASVPVSDAVATPVMTPGISPVDVPPIPDVPTPYAGNVAMPMDTSASQVYADGTEAASGSNVPLSQYSDAEKMQLSQMPTGAAGSGGITGWFNSLSPLQKAGLGLGAYGLYNQMAKPNLLPTYTPPTAASYGIGRTLASNYRPVRPMAEGGIAQLAEGGITQLAVGGKLLQGPGDGMSDSIKANISGQQEARLGDGEFVVPADVVSHLGNGSTDAGAKQLYSMMDKVRKARTGRKAQGRQINPEKYMPA